MSETLGLPTKLRYPQVLSELALVVAKHPTRVYHTPESRVNAGGPACWYAHPAEGDRPAEPGCLLGWWLHTHHQVSVETLDRLDGVGGITTVLERLEIRTTAKVDCFLLAAQREQDTHVSWQEAFWHAVRETEELGYYEDEEGYRGLRVAVQ